MHRDLKLQNILVKGSLIKIGDFGLSKISSCKNSYNHTQGTGTPLYNSYEVLKKINYS